ncbi:hypothetical protein [Streptomyces rubellomurinus]|uniref:Uncharacterized protein n=1 Tax=Streptomyces rubellomurinus (strain ATCC 31215) TaxID=359131 RepID=A0A0F2TJ84_STRR3|nr:hypothetical protein [Streptomyces rubellomurinus]KJS62340.1 hypothetical protein VM95_09085 [Streptomyces rubellomurinus]
MINGEDLVGRRLQKVTTSWHHYQETEPSLLHMWLHMDGLGPVRFHTPGDGLSLEIDQPHGPYDMDEYGHTTVEDDLPGFPMTRFIGQQILSVREIRYQDGNYDFAIGITAQFPGGTIRVLNLADEIVLAHDQHLGPVEVHLRIADA